MTKQAISLRQIGNGMGRSHRSLSREIKRNKGENGYRYKQAQRKALARHKTKPKAIKLTEELILYVRQKIKEHWSPEQISGRLLIEKNVSLSHETICQFILKNKRNCGDLYRYLRHQAKPYRKRYGSNDYRGKIPGKVDISERRGIVDERSRVGDWEADLVIGKGHKGAGFCRKF
jgi:IS30 family transposase